MTLRHAEHFELRDADMGSRARPRSSGLSEAARRFLWDWGCDTRIGVVCALPVTLPDAGPRVVVSAKAASLLAMVFAPAEPELHRAESFCETPEQNLTERDRALAWETAFKTDTSRGMLFSLGLNFHKHVTVLRPEVLADAAELHVHAVEPQREALRESTPEALKRKAAAVAKRAARERLCGAQTPGGPLVFLQPLALEVLETLPFEVLVPGHATGNHVGFRWRALGIPARSRLRLEHDEQFLGIAISAKEFSTGLPYPWPLIRLTPCLTHPFAALFLRRVERPHQRSSLHKLLGRQDTERLWVFLPGCGWTGGPDAVSFESVTEERIASWAQEEGEPLDVVLRAAARESPEVFALDADYYPNGTLWDKDSRLLRRILKWACRRSKQSLR